MSTIRAWRRTETIYDSHFLFSLCTHSGSMEGRLYTQLAMRRQSGTGPGSVAPLWLAGAVPWLPTYSRRRRREADKVAASLEVELRVAVFFFVQFPIPQLVKPGETLKKKSIQNPGALRVDFPFGLDASHTAELSPASIGSLLALLHDVHPTHTSIPVLLHMRENWLNEPKSG